jgi:hypothetical protein
MSGAPLGGVNVTVASFDLPAGELGLVTNDRGAFQTGAVPPGLYDIFATATEFLPGEIRDVRLEDGRTATVEIVLVRRDGSAGY